jgi:hypothetical protein
MRQRVAGGLGRNRIESVVMQRSLQYDTSPPASVLHVIQSNAIVLTLARWFKHARNIPDGERISSKSRSCSALGPFAHSRRDDSTGKSHPQFRLTDSVSNIGRGLSCWTSTSR